MTFNPTEKHQSQLPALQLLVALGYTPLSQAEALHCRGGRLRNVLLDDILTDRLLAINRFAYRGRRYRFDLEDAHEAIRCLHPSPDQVQGLRRTNQEIYDLLVLGTSITQKIGGDSKSYSFRYVDWEEPANNVYHVTAEMEVERTGSFKTRRLDVVAFVNGIPFIVIENKRPTESVQKAGSQLIGYQHEDNIPHFFHFAHLLLALNRKEARYATVGTAKKFWQGWREPEPENGGSMQGEMAMAAEPTMDDVDTTTGVGPQRAAGASILTDTAPDSTGYQATVVPADLQSAINRPLAADEAAAIYSGDFAAARPYFEALADEGARAITPQDRAIHALCRPSRLLDLVRRFTVFDAGVRKIARHQQYFAVHHSMQRIKHIDPTGKRQGGVVWHTQGSGKSLTMVMLGRALALDNEIVNPRIIIVTDRTDLDRQIRDTFKSCELEPVRARSGRHLFGLIRDRTPLVTTLVNKFDTALRYSGKPDDDPNLFVLVDESHRSHAGKFQGYGQMALKMRRLLPGACYLGFTGTPLLSREKSTFATFGGLIHRYAIDEAVEDGAVVPLLYEGRFVDQQVSAQTIDSWFDKLCEPLNEDQRADLKRKFSRLDALSQTEQAIRAKALDISEHFHRHWQGTGFKAQLVAPSKAAAIRFKEALDEIGDVTSEIVISAPDDREGNEEVDETSKDTVRAFWAKTMERHGSETEYNRRVIDTFKGPGTPEILIVVSKLLTGFDAPRNTVLYVCKPLKEHNLLQAIARVNRLHEEGESEKKFGFIIDYQGLLGELDSALNTYSALEGYDPDDLVGAVLDVREEVGKLSHYRGRLWDLFQPVRNKKDMEAMEQFLADEAIRQDFYGRLRAFSRCLHISLSSEKVFDVFDEGQIAEMKRDWRGFSDLRQSVRIRYQEAVDVKEFEPKIRRLLDRHVAAKPAETVIKLVDIHDTGVLKAVVEETGITSASKADRIASATRRAITERMDLDPAFYERFSKLLEDTIEEYRQKRKSESDYLDGVVKIASKVARGHEERDVPAALRGNDHGMAFYGIFKGTLKDDCEEALGDDEAAEVALAVMDIIHERHIVDVWSNETAQNGMRNAIDDYFYDVLRDEKGIELTEAQMDDLLAQIMRLAEARLP
ncbi:MAG: HsdR family type I site-specific deoxyribonuclease [Gemmatimonadota bacterium]|nr:HsdR family type I site-specific deoxyribonuclease [Gemmatimonadota bacterium]